MDDIHLSQHIFKVIKDRRDRIIEMLEYGSPDNMEEYCRLVGCLESLNFINSELRIVLDKQEE